MDEQLPWSSDKAVFCRFKRKIDQVGVKMYVRNAHFYMKNFHDKLYKNSEMEYTIHNEETHTDIWRCIRRLHC